MLPLKTKKTMTNQNAPRVILLPFSWFAYPFTLFVKPKIPWENHEPKPLSFKVFVNKEEKSTFKLLCVTVCGSASLWNSKMFLLRFLCGKWCKPTTDEDLESQGYQGVSAVNVGVTALAHDPSHFEINSQVHMFSSGFNFFENWNSNPNVFELSDKSIFWQNDSFKVIMKLKFWAN